MINEARIGFLLLEEKQIASGVGLGVHAITHRRSVKDSFPGKEQRVRAGDNSCVI